MTMTIKAPTALNSIIADYAPGVAVRMMTYEGDHHDAAFITPAAMTGATKVKEFLKTFNMQSYLLLYKAQIFAGEGSLFSNVFSEESVKNDSELKNYKEEIHFSDDMDSQIEGYKAIRAIIFRLAPKLNHYFGSHSFDNGRFGYGYIRPQVRFATALVGQISSKTILVEDERLVPYTKQQNGDVAEETALMFSEAGAVATLTMARNAIIDKQTGIQGIIEAQQNKQNS